MNYYLFKSEPTCYSIDDLKRDGVEHWDGIRNYQARNILRDEVKVGDQVLFYHSSCAEPGVVGLCEVVKEAYPDHTAFDPNSEHPDPKSTPDNPRWLMVNVKFKAKFKRNVTLSQIKEMSEFSGIRLAQRGNRLSLFSIDKAHFELLCKLGQS